MRTAKLAAAILLLLAPAATARLWKPTPAQLAADYATITHNKGAEGRVVISWVAAPVVAVPSLKTLMEKYVVLSIAHVRSGAGGTTDWDDVQGVQVTDGNNQPLKEVTPDAIPPELVGFTAAADAVARQNSRGKAKPYWAIYEARSFNACQKGRLLVTYDGETYSFDTPLPGCDKN